VVTTVVEEVAEAEEERTVQESEADEVEDEAKGLRRRFFRQTLLPISINFRLIWPY
jgi:hypothetical protein